jgi:hypothetical protein
MSTDNENWSTREVGLWLANDESMYLRAKRCQTVDELREAFDEGGIRGVDYSTVDWDALFEQFEEDRT